jgi:2-methylcitrate dehydratase
MGYPSALTAKTWGFYDVLFKGKPFAINQPYGSYVMENVLFKISFPAEFHAQTAVECALQLHPNHVNNIDTLEKINHIDRIEITTHESAIRIIDKTGPLNNPADRDHCIQYMTTVGLLKGNLTALDYEDAVAQDPRIDALRAKMQCIENKQFTQDYLDPSKRSIANALQIFYQDGTHSEKITVEYPIGHRRRRTEGIPELIKKFSKNLNREFDPEHAAKILNLNLDYEKLAATPVHEYVNLFVK